MKPIAATTHRARLRLQRDGSNTPAPWRYALVALVALAGCTNKAPSDQGNDAATPAAASTTQRAASSADAYPAWAAAVVPPYTSHVTSSGATTDQYYQVYQIYTTDPYETVLAWYKARIKTEWPSHRSDQTVGKVGKISITLQKYADPTDQARTMIGFIKHA